MPFALIVGHMASPESYIIECSTRDWNEFNGASALNSYVERWYRIDMRKNPTYVILDSGCTRNMGSMARVMAFVRYCEQFCSWITFEWRWQPVKFSFANSHWSWVYWTLVIHYDLSDTASADQYFSIEISVLEEGDVPILLSNKMMGIMNLDIINREECTLSTAHAWV